MAGINPVEPPLEPKGNEQLANAIDLVFDLAIQIHAGKRLAEVQSNNAIERIRLHLLDAAEEGRERMRRLHGEHRFAPITEAPGDC